MSCSEDNKVLAIDEKSKEIKKLFVSSNFLQDIITIKDNLFIAGYNDFINVIDI